MKPFLADLLQREVVLSRVDHPELASALGHLARRGDVTAILPGVYVLPHLATDFATRVLALSRYDRDAVLTGRAAARLGFWKGLDVPVVTAVCRNRRVDHPGFRFSTKLVPPDLVIEQHGVRIMSPALAALDLCGELGGDGIDTVLRTGRATLAQLQEALAATRHSRGQTDRRRLMLESRAEPWSAAERKLHNLLREAGITDWRANLEIRVRGRTRFLDVAFPAARVAIEVDSRAHHGLAAFETDRERQNDVVLAGWLVLRFTWAMLEDEPDEVIRRVREALRMRKSAPQPRRKPVAARNDG